MLLVILMWGTNFVFYKILVENVSFWLLLFFRNFFATLAIFWFVRKSFKRTPHQLKTWMFVVLASFSGIFINNVFFQTGIEQTTATNAALIMALTPLTTAIMSYIAFREPLHWKRVIGIFLGFFGVVLVILRGSIATLLELSINPGDLYVVGNLLLFSLSFMFIKKAVDRDFSPELITMYGHGMSLLFIFPFLFWEQWNLGFGTIPTDALHWILLIYIGIFPAAIGNMLWNKGIALLGPNQAAIFMNGTPLVTAITSYVVLSETLVWPQLIGFLFIATGIILGSQTNPAPQRKLEKSAIS